MRRLICTEASSTAQSRQKSYADTRRQPLEFEVGDHVFLKVMPNKGVVKFDKRGKLSLRYIGPFEILERVGIVAYRLALPPSLSGLHEVFHVSMLQKYTPDPTHVLDWGNLIIDTNGTFEEGPVHIKDSQDRKDTMRALILSYLRTKVRCLVIWYLNDCCICMRLSGYVGILGTKFC